MNKPPVPNGTEPRSHPELPCGTGDWDSSVYGNHRIVVRVEESADAVRVKLPWRRRDDPNTVGTLVLAPSGRRILNVLRTAFTPADTTLVFEPLEGPGDYYAHYLPYGHVGGRHYPQDAYLAARVTAHPEWRHRTGIAVRFSGGPEGPQADLSGIPEVRAVRYEAASAIDSFAPMGFAATEIELVALRNRHPGMPFALIPERREYAFGRGPFLPAPWAGATPFAAFEGTARRGEYFTFQVAVHAFVEIDVTDVHIRELPFHATCLNTQGRSWRGYETRREVPVAAGHTQSLWIGVAVPEDAVPGMYPASVRISAGCHERDIPLMLTVEEELAEDHGDGEPQHLSRLAWLDSALAEDEEVVAPFEPVQVEGNRLTVLGRVVELGENGLPARIASTFNSAVTRTDAAPRELLRGPAELLAGRSWQFNPLTVVDVTANRARWQTTGTAGPLTLQVDGSLEADGSLTHEVRLSSDEECELDDVQLSLPLAADVARYFMGLGLRGQLCPEEFSWQWDVGRLNQDALWIGDVSAGVQLSLYDDTYERPLNSNFYRQQPLRSPRSWDNEGRGGITVRTEEGVRHVEAYSGTHRLVPGDELRFDFRLLLTPFKPIEPRRHLAERYYHAYATPEEAAAYGANVLNLHHATPPNPYINDPLLTADALSAYVARAHELGMKVKIYHTVREISRYSPEFTALGSLGDEIFAPGPRGGRAWLQEHLSGGYVPGWYAPDVEDVAVVVRGDSRWQNFYVCALERAARVADVDGVYLDDVAYGRTTMKRVRKVLSQRHRPLIDLHSCSQYNEGDGFASSANLYLELMPYVDRLWFGENFDYESTDPVYWLLESSGIAFGLMGDMMQDGGNPWRGLVFGMTGRAPFVDNRPLWRAFDELSLTDAEMYGWWAADNPVRTCNPAVLATCWVRDGQAVVALASWAEATTEVTLDVDWQRLGLRPRMAAPPIEGFQPELRCAPDVPVSVEPGRGLLLVLG